ncbi:hypothetical protein HBI23_198590 [Parastagonospora nodorum]|nr:hypothetical protein HBI47_128380 [Parastagonospora nodorum]KAH5641512.1 hypothetical protein HBI23_198590 [Parastagonospora nodorum]
MQRSVMATADGRSSTQQLRLLCLDGGGVRGLSSLMVLKMLMEMIDPDNPPKPCDYFDMIGGTSTGGLIAIMLGRLQMSVQECIDEYTTLFSSIFTKKKHRVGWGGKLQGRFDHEALEAGIKRIVGEKLNDENALFKDNSSNGGCKTFVCATSATTSETVIMSSYYSMRRLNDIRNVARIWEVGRATSAATSFFDSIQIKGSTYLDGGTGANNPINKLWAEADDAFRQGPDWRLEDNLLCMVSIGTGQPLLKKFGDSILGTDILDALVDITTNTETTANDFQQAHAQIFEQGIAYRFNVEQGLENVALEDATSAGKIEEVTRRYLSIEKSNAPLRRCVSRLKASEDSDGFSIQNFEEYLVNVEDLTPLQESDIDLCFVPHTTSYLNWVNNHEGGVLAYQKPSTRVSANSLTQIGRRILASALFDESLPLYYEQHKLILYHDCQSGSGLTSVLSSLCLQLLALPIPKDARNALSTSLSREHSVAFLQDQRSSQRETIQSLPTDMLQHALTSILPRLKVSTWIGIDNLDALVQTSTSTGRRDDSWRTTLTTVLIYWAQECFLTHIVVTDTSRFPQSPLSTFSKDPSAYIDQVDYDTELRECMSTMDFDRRLERQKEIVHAINGTTDWFWNHPTYTSWRDKQAGILWIQGKPGSGKSVLAKNILDPVPYLPGKTDSRDQKSLSREIDAHTCEWYYSTRGGDEMMAHISLLRSLLYQLLSSNSRLFHHFKTIYRSHGPGSNDWITLDNMKSIFAAIANAGVSILCLIDAMDESEDEESKMARKHILRFLAKTTLDHEDSRVKFVILSRPEYDIEGFFTYFHENYDDLGVIKMHEANHEAVRIIVDVGIESLVKSMRPFELSPDDDDENAPRRKKPKKRTRPGHYHQQRGATLNLPQRDQDELETVRKFLLSNAEGVILWVTVCIATVKAMMGTFYTWQAVRQCLEALPTDLHLLYKQIILDIHLRLNAQELKLARRILMWTAGATTWHPLRTVELLEAISISEEGKFQSVVVLDWSDFRYLLRRYCGPFIDIIHTETSTAVEGQANSADIPVSSFDRVQLLHRTAKDFLASYSNAKDLSFSEDEAKELVLGDLFTYEGMLKSPLHYSRLYQDADVSGFNLDKYTEALASSLNDRGLALHLSGRRSTLPGPKLDARELLISRPQKYMSRMMPQSRTSQAPQFVALLDLTVPFFGQCIYFACIHGYLTAAELLLQFSTDISRSRYERPDFLIQITHSLLLASVKLNFMELGDSLANMSFGMLGMIDYIDPEPMFRGMKGFMPHTVWLRTYQIPGTNAYANRFEIVAAEEGYEELLKIIMGHTEAILSQSYEAHVEQSNVDKEELLKYVRKHSLRNRYEPYGYDDSRVAIEMGVDYIKSTFDGMEHVIQFFKQMRILNPALNRKIRRATGFYHQVNRTDFKGLDRISLVKKYATRWRKRALNVRDVPKYKEHAMRSVVEQVIQNMRRQRTDFGDVVLLLLRQKN